MNRLPEIVFVGVALTAVLAAASPAVAQPPLATALTELVGHADPAARRKAADALAASDHTIEALLAAMREFGTFERPAPGRSDVTVPLWIGKSTEATRLHHHVPKSYDSKQPAPLLLIGHGTGGNGRHMIPMWVRFAEATGTILLAPSEAGPNGGWAFSHRERQSARSAIRYMRRRFNVDENRIYCTGVSRGGHLAWDVALRYPDLFAAIAPMIGGPRIKRVQGQNNLRYLENIAQLPIRDLQGAKDDPYLVANVRLAFKRLEQLQAPNAKLIEFPHLGHSFEMGAVDWTKFFRVHVRNPVPKCVVRMMASQRETRAFWIEVLAKDARRVRVIPQIPMTKKFASMSDAEQREYVARESEKGTARLEVKMLGVGDFFARSRYVKKFRLLLTPAMFEAGKRVRVKHNGRIRRFTVKPSKTVLCREFAERFDRRFLPVAEVVVR